MSFNTVTIASGEDKVHTAVVNQISVDAINVKVLPAGSSPSVVYRVGDGLTPPEVGFENTLDYKYLDFYVSTGAQGIKGDKGEAGESAYSQAVAGGYTGTQVEFYALLTEVTDNAINAAASAAAALLSEQAAALSETATAADVVTTAANVITTGNNAALTAADVVTTAADVISAAGSAATATAQANAANNSATSASGSAATAISQATTATTQAGIATTQATNSANSASSAQLKAWEAEARKLTADSYATQSEDTFVTNFTSNGNGTFSTNPTSEYSALHWAAKAAAFTGILVNQLPISLSGAITGVELTEVVITDSAYDASATYLASVNFGSVVDNADGTYTVTLPEYTVSTSVEFSLGGDKIGAAENLATYNIVVTNTQVSTPVIIGNNTGAEGTTIVLTNTAHEPTATYYRSTDYGSSIDNGDGTYSVTLPAFNVAPTNVITFSLQGTRVGDIHSELTQYTITVTEVTFVADTAVTDDMSVDVISDGF